MHTLNNKWTTFATQKQQQIKQKTTGNKQKWLLFTKNNWNSPKTIINHQKQKQFNK